MKKRLTVVIFPLILALLTTACQTQDRTSPVAVSSTHPQATGQQDGADSTQVVEGDPFANPQITFTPKEPNSHNSGNNFWYITQPSTRGPEEPVVVGFGLKNAQGLNNYLLEADDAAFFQSALDVRAMDIDEWGSSEQSSAEKSSEQTLFIYFKKPIHLARIETDNPFFETYALRFEFPQADFAPFDIYALGYDLLKEKREIKLPLGDALRLFPSFTWVSQQLLPRLKNRTAVSHEVRILPPSKIELSDPIPLDDQTGDPKNLGNLLGQISRFKEAEGFHVFFEKMVLDRPNTPEIAEALQELLELRVRPHVESTKDQKNKEENTPVIIAFYVNSKSSPYRPMLDPHQSQKVSLAVSGDLKDPSLISLTLTNISKPFRSGWFTDETIEHSSIDPLLLGIKRGEDPTPFWEIEGLKTWFDKWKPQIQAAYPGF